MRVAVYVSGHGFGHLAQVAPVLARLREAHPGARFLVRCGLPEGELRARLRFDFVLDRVPVDVGVVQRHAIEEDPHASVRRLREWLAGFAGHLDREAALLGDFGADVVLSNVSPLAFPVARRLGIPGLALATLDWHEIYRHWLPADDPALAMLASAYGECDELLVPPLAMAMSAFPQRRAIPLVVADPRESVVAGDADRRRCLVLFGGSGTPPYAIEALAGIDGWAFFVPGIERPAAGNVEPLPRGRAIIDLMQAVDCVVCKPGYGVLSECWRTQTPIVWVERSGFPEYPVLARWLEERFPAVRLEREAFERGDWTAALTRAVRHPRCFPRLEGDGARLAAEIVAGWAAGRR